VKPIVVYWKGRGFGDRLLAAFLARVLRDHGVEAYRQNGHAYSLVDCPALDAQSEHTTYRFNYRHGGESMLADSLKELATLTGRHIGLTRNSIPVYYVEIDGVAPVDVAICSRTGPFSNVRNWPYFDDLKVAFRKAGITYVDLNEVVRTTGREADMLCLNYVKKSRLYLGLDTGISHFVSSLANGKALILQSGYSPFSWWCFYGYDRLELDLECKPCWLRSVDTCPHGHRCMRQIGVEQVVHEVAKRIGAQQTPPGP